MKNKAPHTACGRGKRIKIVLRNGEIIYDRFLDRDNKSVILKENGRINKNQIKSFTIVKK